jgi:hypothetical protein
MTPTTEAVMTTQTKDRTTRATEQSLEEAANTVRELNERIVESSRKAGEAYLRTYERGLKSFADLHEEVARTSPFEWVGATAKAQADFVRDVAEAYGAAGRELARTTR